MLSTFRSGVAQLGHRERGRTRDSPAGTRWIATVRKLPNTRPTGRAIARRSSTSGSVMVAAERYRTDPVGRLGGDFADVHDVLLEAEDLPEPRDDDRRGGHREVVV